MHFDHGTKIVVTNTLAVKFPTDVTLVSCSPVASVAFLLSTSAEMSLTLLYPTWFRLLNTSPYYSTNFPTPVKRRMIVPRDASHSRHVQQSASSLAVGQTVQ